MGTEQIFPSRILKFGRHFERGGKKNSISPRAILAIYTSGRTHVWHNFFLNRFFGTTHGGKPTSQNGISLGSPSLIMAPDSSYFALGLPVTVPDFDFAEISGKSPDLIGDRCHFYLSGGIGAKQFRGLVTSLNCRLCPPFVRPFGLCPDSTISGPVFISRETVKSPIVIGIFPTYIYI